MHKATVGHIVSYRSHLGPYDVPAVVVADAESVVNSNGAIAPLDTDSHLHLQVLTPTMRDDADDPDHPRSENVNGIYLRLNVAYDPKLAPGTWHFSQVHR